MSIINPYISGGVSFKVSLHNHQNPDTGSSSPEYRGNQGDDGDLDSSVVGARAETATLDAVAMTSHEFMEDDSDIETATSVTWIPSVEIHDWFGRNEGFEYRSIHITGINVPLVSWPLSLDSSTNRTTAQDIIDNYIAEGAAAILAHPNIDFYSNAANGYTNTNSDVSNGGNRYVCKSGHTSSVSTEPGVGASWENVWLDFGEDTLSTAAWLTSTTYEPYALKGQYYITQEEIDALTDWHAMEIYSSTPALYYGIDGAYADGSNGSINKIDPTLKKYGFFTLVAVSDFHRDSIQAQFVDQTGGDKSTTIDDGFTVIFAASLTPANVSTAVKTGNAYATQGPLLASAPTVNVNTITVNSDDSCICLWTDEDGTIVQTDTAGTLFSYTMVGEKYVRPTLTRVSDDKMLWVQAFFMAHVGTITIDDGTIREEVPYYDDYTLGDTGGVVLSNGIGHYRVGLVDSGGVGDLRDATIIKQLKKL